MIDIVDNMPWGTHLCQAYQSTQDLLDILIPYFKIGLESNEYCIYVAKSTGDLKDIKTGLAGALGDIAKYERAQQLELVGYKDFLLAGGVFDIKRAINL